MGAQRFEWAFQYLRTMPTNCPRITFLCGRRQISSFPTPHILMAWYLLWPTHGPRLRVLCGSCLSGKSPHLSIWEVFSKASNPLPIKALCYTLGWIRSPETRLPLDHHDFSDYALIESALKFMKDWLIEIKD